MGRLLRCKHTDSLRCLFSRAKSLSEPVIIIITIRVWALVKASFFSRMHPSFEGRISRMRLPFLRTHLSFCFFEFAQGAVVSVFGLDWIYVHFHDALWDTLSGRYSECQCSLRIQDTTKKMAYMHYIVSRRQFWTRLKMENGWMKNRISGLQFSTGGSWWQRTAVAIRTRRSCLNVEAAGALKTVSGCQSGRGRMINIRYTCVLLGLGPGLRDGPLGGVCFFLITCYLLLPHTTPLSGFRAKVSVYWEGISWV